MNDSTLLYAGMFCFVLTLLGLALTIYEFRKMSRSIDKSTKAAQAKAPTFSPTGISKVRVL